MPMLRLSSSACVSHFVRVAAAARGKTFMTYDRRNFGCRRRWPAAQRRNADTDRVRVRGIMALAKAPLALTIGRGAPHCNWSAAPAERLRYLALLASPCP
jgi:hypothetical protein